MIAFALDYLKRMGWDRTQHIIIRHDDHDYDHIHMALNIIGDDGKPLDMKFYKTRSQRICYKMTKEYGLYFAKDKKSVNRSALKGKDKLKYQIADSAMSLLGKCKSLKEFREALAKKGINTTIVPRRDGKGLGIVYTITDKKFSIGGAKCDQSLKFSALEKEMDVSDDEDVQKFRCGQYTRPSEGKLTEGHSIEQGFEAVYGDDFSNTEEKALDNSHRNYYNISQTATLKEDDSATSDIVKADVEIATGGTQVVTSTGGGGGQDDDWWERQRQKSKQEQIQAAKRKARR